MSGGPLSDTVEHGPTVSYAERLAAAEAHVTALADSYEVWVREDLAALQVALDGANQRSRRHQAFDRIFKIAHNIKGQGSTFGYDLLTEIAGSLCEFIRRLSEPGDDDLALVRHHVSAIGVVLEQRITGSGGKLGEDLLTRLRHLTDPNDAT